MSRIWGMMDVGKRSMANSQTALQTVSHNIANKSTEGYSRQRVDIKSNEPTGLGKLRIGNGAHASSVSRTNNSYLEKQLENEGSKLGTSQTRSETLGRVEQVFNEQQNKGLNKYMAEFFNAMREFSNNPESLATRSLVKESADFLTKDFRRVHNQLVEIQRDADFQIKTHVAQINELTKEVANLNEKIQSVELTGAAANDERDRRDVIIKKLSEKINIRYAEGENGQVAITAGDSALLVSGFSSRELTATPTSGRDGKREGNVDIFYKATETGSPIRITEQMRGGQVGGLLDVRDKTINQTLEKVDTMAHTLATKLNSIHREGYNRYNQKAGNFFEVPVEQKDASLFIKLDDSILDDVGLIANAAAPDSPADNRVANIMASMQYRPILENQTSSLDDFYSSVVGQVGVEANRAVTGHQSQQDIVKQLKNIRESVSGVSIDEEATKMIEYQKSFDASARLIRTADEMMDTVLAIKR